MYRRAARRWPSRGLDYRRRLRRVCGGRRARIRQPVPLRIRPRHDRRRRRRRPGLFDAEATQRKFLVAGLGSSGWRGRLSVGETSTAGHSAAAARVAGEPRSNRQTVDVGDCVGERVTQRSERHRGRRSAAQWTEHRLASAVTTWCSLRHHRRPKVDWWSATKCDISHRCTTDIAEAGQRGTFCVSRTHKLQCSTAASLISLSSAECTAFYWQVPVQQRAAHQDLCACCAAGRYTA